MAFYKRIPSILYHLREMVVLAQFNALIRAIFFLQKFMYSEKATIFCKIFNINLPNVNHEMRYKLTKYSR